MVVVVVLGIVSVFIVFVVQKSREIGILCAVGVLGCCVQRVFLIQGGVFGLVGLFLGSVFGAGFVKLFENLVCELSGVLCFFVWFDLWLFVVVVVLVVGVGFFVVVVLVWCVVWFDFVVVICNGWFVFCCCWGCGGVW